MNSWSLDINVPTQTRAAIAACKNKRGLGMTIARAMDRENELTVNRVQQKLTGEVLHVRTGLLRRSISRTDALVLDTEVRSAVGSNVRTGGQAVKYAAIHEFGGQTKAHIIRPKNKKALSFTVGGKTICRKMVHHPGSKMPERSYLRSTLTERKGDYQTTITGAAQKFLGGEQ